MNKEQKSLDIEINGTPKINLMPNDTAEAFFMALELTISQMLEDDGKK